MQYITIILISVCIVVVLYAIISKSKRKIKILIKDEELDKLVNKMPENVNIAKTILKKLGNNKTSIEEVENTKTSLYIAITDKITIGNIKDTFIRIQTIAHECIHSIQNRKLLLFNFIYSNIYLIYYIAIIILTITGIIHNYMLHIVIYTLLSFVYYLVRSILEIDAMERAKYVAKEYLEENNLCTKEECDKIINKYQEINEVGIPASNYAIFVETLVKIIIYCIIVLIIGK